VINKEIMIRQKAGSEIGKRQTEILWLIAPRNNFFLM